MATQLCPKCEKDSFTWRMDDEQSDLTVWGCSNCEYLAFENENDERTCQNCGQKTESKLKDKEKTYWWCSSCNSTSEIKTA